MKGCQWFRNCISNTTHLKYFDKVLTAIYEVSMHIVLFDLLLYILI